MAVELLPPADPVGAAGEVGDAGDDGPNPYADSVEAGGPGELRLGQEAPGPGCALGDRDPIRGVGAPGAVVPPPGARPSTGAAPIRDDLGVGARRRTGIQSVDAAATVGNTGTTRLLLSRSLETTGRGVDQQLRFRIGDETLTAGQLRQAIDQDPARFRDFLRGQGISVAELNEVLDDLNSGTVAPGTEIDLRPGSEIARAYRMGGSDGAVVDSHLNRGATLAAAAREPGLGEREGLAGERVEGPGFFQMIGEALAEAVAAIGRVFGSSWNPDTVTFNGRVDDDHFRGLGRVAARGDQSLAMQAVLSSPQGEAELRRQLQAQRPSGATELQWNRAVDDYVAGARGGLASEVSAGRLPEMSPADSQQALLYLRAHGFSDQAKQELRTVLAQPAEVRSSALRMLNALPDTERATMLALLTPPGEPPPEGATDAEYTADNVRNGYQAADPAAQAAIFEAFRRDGFRTPLGADAANDVTSAAAEVQGLPEGMRARGYALVRELGPERANLLTGTGLFSQLQRADPVAAERLLTRFEADLGSTHDLERLLGANGAEIRLTDPEASTITRASDQARVVDTFDAANLSLRATDGETGQAVRITARGSGEGEISLQRYFSDRSYRDDVLRRTGMTRASFEGMLSNVSNGVRRDDSRTSGSLEAQRDSVRAALLNPNTPAADREGLSHRLQQIEQQLEIFRAPVNVELDISSGSRLHQLFDLSGPGGARHAELQLAAEGIRDRPADFSLRLRAPGAGRRPGPEYTISQQELGTLIQNAGSLDAARTAFQAQYPGLDFDETVRGFAALSALDRRGDLPGESGQTLDFTRSQRDRAVERIRRPLVDRTAGNTRGGPVEFQLGAATTSTRTPTTHLGTDARLGATSSNQWYQYGVFDNTGYLASGRAETRSRTAFEAAGRRADPSIPLDALFQMDDYANTSHLSNGSYTRELGVAHGETSDFMIDPRTGVRAEPQDFQVLSFSGRGSATDVASFRRSSDRVAGMFRRFGGVPESQVETHHNPTPDSMFRAIEGEILRDPRAPAARLDADGNERRRTVVVHYAGHTGSYGGRGDREVAGFTLTDERGNRVELTPAQMEQLNRTARENDVNLVWVVDACRGGEFVDQARSLDQAALDATGSVPTEAAHLQGLREGLREQHVVLARLTDMRPRTPMPNAAGLATMGARALQGGDGSAALTALQDRRDQVVARLGADSDEARLMNRYVAGIETTLRERGALNGVAGLENITGDGLVTGATTWRQGRRFMTFTAGPLEDRITAQLRARLPDAPVVPRDPVTTGVRP